MRYLVTGATGLLGKCLVTLLLREGHQVIAISRSADEAQFERSSRLTVVRGNLLDPQFADRQVQQADIVIHCAAKTTNWGTTEDFRLGNVVMTRNLVDACDKYSLQRLLHVSSIAVYGHPAITERKVCEADVVGQRLLTFDRYNRSKIEAERVVGALDERAAVVRPTWFIGPGDKTFVPAIAGKLRKGALRVLGSGTNRLNGLAVEDVARGCVLAATHGDGGGKIFNLCSEGEITQIEFLDIICQHYQIPPLGRHIPMWVAWSVASVVEYGMRATWSQVKPPMTRHDLTVFSRPPRFSNEKARNLLGWQPAKSLEQSLRETLAWETSTTT